MHTVRVILFAVMRILNILDAAIIGRIAHARQVCINPEHQADDVLIQHQANNRFRPGSHIHRINPENPVGNVISGAHSHGSSIVIGAHTHTLNKQYSVSDIK